MSLDYSMVWSDSSLKSPFTLSVGTTNSSVSSLTLTGRGDPNWGQSMVQNLMHIMESSASPTAPANPTIGQLWWDSVNLQLGVYNGSVWKQLRYRNIANATTPTTYANAAGPNIFGDLWYDTTNDVLKVYTISSGWHGVAGPPQIFLTLTSTTAGYNLFLLAGSPTTPIVLNVSIAPGVQITAPNTSTIALDTGSAWAVGSQINITNNGLIIGRGGNGGGGGNGSILGGGGGFTGGAGGNALNLPWNTNILGSGSIVAGGGGGGGGGGWGTSGYATGGGGGGGGGAALGGGGNGGGGLQSPNVPGGAGSAGTYTTGGAFGNGAVYGYTAGHGGLGGYGTAGANGQNSINGGVAGPGGSGGAVGSAITGNSYALSNSNTIIGPTS